MGGQLVFSNECWQPPFSTLTRPSHSLIADVYRVSRSLIRLPIESPGPTHAPL
jgi:hypothetical protein